MGPFVLNDVFDSIPDRWRMEQWPEEIRPFAAFVRREWSRIGASHVVELGVRHGGTSVLWHQLLPEALVIGVDRVGVDSYSEPEFSQRANEMMALYPRYQFVAGDTEDPNTFATVSAAIGREEAVGLLFIDADHNYKAVSRDYERFGKLVAPGGLIAFHDLVDTRGVARFWSELKSSSKKEFCCGGDWGGIGVVRK